MTQWKRISLSIATIAALLGTAACVNFFDPIDNPGGDRQLLSAARAAFDEGDIATARELYGKVSSDEAARAELIFLDLDSCGADIGAFASALSKAADAPGAPGIMLSVMGEKLYGRQSAACFATFLAAYKTARTLVDPNLKGFTTFLAAVAIAGEVFANSTGVIDGTLTKADIFTTPATCNTANACTGCTKADGISTAAAVDLNAAVTISQTYGTLKGAMTAAATALNELAIPNGPSNTLVAALVASDSTDDQAFSCVLSEMGTGR